MWASHRRPAAYVAARQFGCCRSFTSSESFQSVGACGIVDKFESGRHAYRGWNLRGDGSVANTVRQLVQSPTRVTTSCNTLSMSAGSKTINQFPM